MENLKGNAAHCASAFLYNQTDVVERPSRCSGRSIPFFGHPLGKHAGHGRFRRSRDRIIDSLNESSVSHRRVMMSLCTQYGPPGHGIGREARRGKRCGDRLRLGGQFRRYDRGKNFNDMSYNKIYNGMPADTPSLPRHIRVSGRDGSNAYARRAACRQTVGFVWFDGGDDGSAGTSRTNPAGTVNQQSQRHTILR